MQRIRHYLKRSPTLPQIATLLSVLLIVLFIVLVTFTSHPPDDVHATVHPEANDNSIRTVWIIGDSLTLGMFASSESAAFRNRLFDALRERHPGHIHATQWVGACTLAELEQRWDSLEGTPDLLFIELGINDLARTENCSHMPEEEWQARFGAMLDRIQRDAPGVKIIVGTIPWSGWGDDTQEFAGALLYNDRITTEAQTRDVVVADLWEATLHKRDGLSTPDQPSAFPPYYHGDNFHPNDLGHQRIANTFFGAYLNTLHRTYLPQITHPIRYDQS